MLSRRNLLLNLIGSEPGIPVGDSKALIRSINEFAPAQSASDCDRKRIGPFADYFPNVVVYTHEGRKALFYDDLLRDKTVMINCMSIKNDTTFPFTRNLVKVQQLLKERVGRDVFIYSITVDPENDTPRALNEFARKNQVGEGWLFLTGERSVIELLRSRLFVSPGGSGHDHHEAVEDCSLALIRYGNEAVGLWGAVPAKSNAESIVARLSWIKSEPPVKGTFMRGGPVPSVEV